MTDAIARHKHAAVVGGGAGGLMAADVLSEAGWQVTIIDQMRSAGRKFLLAGRGGLNITHSEPLHDFLNKYGPDRHFLEPAIRAFDANDLRAWCLDLGEATFIGTSGRVFPESFRGTPLSRALLVRLRDRGVEFRMQHTWEGFDADGVLRFVSRDSGEASSIRCDATVLALGGASWPGTGSTGSWVSVLQQLGIDINPLRAANCGFSTQWSTHFAERFAGSPLKNIELSFGEDRVRGEAVVTAVGIEGGAIYAVSRAVREAIDEQRVATLFIDFQPDRTVQQVTERLQRRRAKDSLSNALRRTISLSPVAIGLMREAMNNNIPEEPDELARLIKHCPITLNSVQPIDRAISTAGGVAQQEVDEHFMLRKLPNVYAIGEMLAWEAPTGGYLLQATMSTAVAAARAIVRTHE